MKLSDEQCVSKINGLEKKQRIEMAHAIADCLDGRSVNELARLLGRDRSWIRDHLDLLGVSVAIGGGGNSPPSVKHEDVRTIIKEFEPDEVDQSYVEYWEDQGLPPAAAERVAKSEQAADAAIEAGVLQESKQKTDKRTAELILPKGTQWDIDLRRACTDVKAAVRLLNEAKISDLRRKITRERIAEVHSLWMEQIERVQNLHPDFDTEVSKHEA